MEINNASLNEPINLVNKFIFSLLLNNKEDIKIRKNINKIILSDGFIDKNKKTSYFNRNSHPFITTGKQGGGSSYFSNVIDIVKKYQEYHKTDRFI